MLKKTVTYQNFNDEPVTEDHYFHLSKAELVEMEVEYEGGLAKKLEEIVEAEDGKAIMAMFKKLLLDSYGVKSPDGKSFMKNPDLRENFASTEAYSTIFMELVTDAGAAADFVNGIIPKGLDQDVDRIVGDQDKPKTSPAITPRGIRGDEHVTGDRPVEKTPRVLTKAEMLQMPTDELSHLLATGEVVISSGE